MKIICPKCDYVKPCGIFDSVQAPVCEDCYAPIVRFKEGLQERELEAKAEENRRERRAAHFERRRVHKEKYGSSDNDFSDDTISKSETWSEFQMRLVQEEADHYMNSPKAGSE